MAKPSKSAGANDSASEAPTPVDRFGWPETGTLRVVARDPRLFRYFVCNIEVTGEPRDLDLSKLSDRDRESLAFDDCLLCELVVDPEDAPEA